MSLRVLNTLGKKKEEFKPKERGKVRMYVCGPTVYNFIHIGNARCYVVFDVVRRYLEYKGYDVYHVQNYTDVDDKIIKRSKEEGLSCAEIAHKYEKAFEEDMNSLNVLRPHVTPRATENIEGMIEMIKVLLDKGYAYEVDGDIYFSVDSFPSYGKLSGRSKEEMLAGARVEVDERKRNPLDFALWKKAKEGEPFWETPWGRGRPGWHIECSVMSLKHLGFSFDIHGGGEDLIFPHHENEIAQSEAYEGSSPFVRYWLHNGLLTIRQEKMAKSVGNIILFRELRKKHSANALRIFYLSTYYRSPLDFSEERIVEATKAWERLENALENIDFFLSKAPHGFSTGVDILKEAVEKSRKDFENSMDDDFNTPRALASLFELAKEVNNFISLNRSLSSEGRETLEEAKENLISLSAVFGLELGKRDKNFLFEREAGLKKLAKKWKVEGDDAETLLTSLLEKREEKRREKKWKEADLIRSNLLSLGFEVEDTPLGPRWRVKLFNE